MKLMKFGLGKSESESGFSINPFMKVSIVWGLGLLSMIMVIEFAMLQLVTFDARVEALIPFLVVLFGSANMVKFVGARPAFYAGMCGVTVGVGMAFLGLLNELLSSEGIYFESFARFLWVAVVRGVGMLGVGAVAGWIMTRGRVPIAIEVPTKKEEDAARRAGMEAPPPRIVTPVSAMPGSVEVNTRLLEQLEKDPTSLMSERERRKFARKQAQATGKRGK
jgi:hypothetical protein